MTNDIRSRGRQRRPLAAALRVAAAMMLLLGAGCSSDDNVIGGPLAELCLVFTPAATAPAPGTVSARTPEEPGCSLIEVEIVATDITDVFAFQSVVKYDPAVAAFLGFSSVGSELESDGVDVTVIAEEQVFGEVTIGATRVGSGDGVDIVGTKPLIKLAFARFGLQGSSGLFDLDEQCLLDSGTPPLPKSATCSGGTFTVP